MIFRQCPPPFFSVLIAAGILLSPLDIAAQNSPPSAEASGEVASVESSPGKPEHTGPLWAVGRIAIGELGAFGATIGGVLVGGVIAGYVIGPVGDANQQEMAAYGMIAGAGLAVPAGYYVGAGSMGSRAGLGATYLGAVGAWGLAAGLSVFDESNGAIFAGLPLSYIGVLIANEISHAYGLEAEINAAGSKAADSTSLQPVIGAGPGDMGLSMGLSF